MKKEYLLILGLIFAGCSVSNTTTKVSEFAKCYVHKVPAPFWICYQSPFLSVGKVHSERFNRLKQEEAYSLGVSELIAKLQAKTKLFLRKLEIQDAQAVADIKDFVVLNAIQGDSWYDEKENMIYVQVKISKEEFKNFLLEKLPKTDKKKFQSIFDETF
jgi:hypothetical protein